jgi:hypothetical protein
MPSKKARLKLFQVLSRLLHRASTFFFIDLNKSCFLTNFYDNLTFLPSLLFILFSIVCPINKKKKSQIKRLNLLMSVCLLLHRIASQFIPFPKSFKKFSCLKKNKKALHINIYILHIE